MATVTRSDLVRSHRRSPLGGKRSHRGRWIALVLVVVVLAAAAGAIYAFSGARLVGDPVALARVELQPFAGSLVTVSASDSAGRRVALVDRGGRLVPQQQLAPGRTISIAVVVRRPGWLSWALGKERHETLTVETPVAQVRDRWLTVPPGAQPRVRFDTTVSAVSFGAGAVRATGASAAVPTDRQAGSIDVSAAARPWEKLGAPVRITWFPKAALPVVLAQPAPGSRVAPAAPLRLTFSRPVEDVLHGSTLHAPNGVAGRWVVVDSHSLVFHPTGRFGMPFASNVSLRLPAAVELVERGAKSVRQTSAIDWTVAPASFLRLEQLLAEQGYLPLDWTPARTVASDTTQAELNAAVSPPAGRFSWRYANTPTELQALWQVGRPNEIMRGAVMTFEDEHGLAVDGIAGPKVWHAALADAVAGKRRTDGYSYVYVHRNVPQKLTLWHNGTVVLTSPGNTGVPAAPTALGTWPVFEHIPVGTMSGTNPDGSHYNDPGIRWISYFHGGEALHAFNRASFGTPQSLGCVELPLDAAAQVWPYTPIGTLVTIEN
jgi:L,D-transpeptidase catalytic domain